MGKGRVVYPPRGEQWRLGQVGTLVLSCLLVACTNPDQGDAFGATCSSDNGCASGMCQGGRCTQTCDASTTCPNEASCVGGVCQPNPLPLEGPISVGLLYVGPVTDHGWTKAHEDGRLYAEEHLDDVEIHASESILPDNAAVEIDSFVENGDQVVVGTSFSFLNALQAKAAAYPDTRFLTCSGFETGPNLGSYFGRMYQVQYLMGVIAGQKTTTNVIGVVGPVCIPETIRHINAFTQGVRAVNAEAQVKVNWIFEWFSTAEEGPATQALINAGADIIVGFTDTSIPLETVRDLQEAPEWPDDAPTVYSMGYDNADSCTFGGDYCISSAYWNWGPVVVRQLRQMREGTWNPRNIIWEQMKVDREESMVHYSPLNPNIISEAVRNQVAQLTEEMARDTDEARMYPFQGPVNDALGIERYAEGELPTDEELLSMCWYVEGASDMDDRPNEVPARPHCGCDSSL